MNEIISQIKKDGIDSILIISDFDATLTKGIRDDKTEASNSFSVFRNNGFLGEEYVKQSKKEAEYYIPIEHDPTVPFKEKEILMEEWWKSHMGNLLPKFGLNKEIINKIIDEQLIEPRENLKEFIHLLQELNIPIFILTAGVGDIIVKFLNNINGTNKNIHIIGNFYDFDNNGFATSLNAEVIHSLNKDLHNVKKFPFYSKISTKTNIILLGDNPNDIKMSKGFNYKNILKIGYLNKLENNHKYEETLKCFKENFDLILDWKSGLQPVIKILEEIKKN